jgi:hypothetical protein
MGIYFVLIALVMYRFQANPAVYGDVAWVQQWR